YIAITLVTDTVNFSKMNISESNDTDDDSPPPFVIRNIGNILVNLTIHATNSLWNNTAAHLNTSYFMFKADNRTEPGSFNFAASNTTWLNMTDYNVTFIIDLNYNSTNDEAEIDLNLTVPVDEPPGNKSSQIVIWVE
ncbi:hypothetical protein KY320_02675, partial [Candidatus Woesearchaeota archaeon]|nr:hypothetical protein [Candidatus Woesearchaeota archaeon]